MIQFASLGELFLALAPCEYLAFVLPLFWAICDETPSPNEIVGKKRDSKPSGKKRQKAAMNLSQYDTFCRWQFAASCRLLPLLKSKCHIRI
jgi:hypothetical protein